jgi:integrase
MKYYGTRCNEAAGLQWTDVYLNETNPYITIRNVYNDGVLKPYTKTKRLKVLPIVPETKWLFEKPGWGFVFTKGKKPWSNCMLNLTWNRANKASGVKICNLYNSMRHSFGCQKLNQGFGLDQIAAIMGHTSTATTKRYAKYQVQTLAPLIGRDGGTPKPIVQNIMPNDWRFWPDKQRAKSISSPFLERS